MTASADLNTTYSYFWPIFRREALYDFDTLGRGGSSSYVVHPNRGRHLGNPLTLEGEIYPSENLSIHLVDHRAGRPYGPPAEQALQAHGSLKWNQLGPNRLHITLSTYAWLMSPGGTKTWNEQNVRLFKFLHSEISELYPEARQQASWMAPLLPSRESIPTSSSPTSSTGRVKAHAAALQRLRDKQDKEENFHQWEQEYLKEKGWANFVGMDSSPRELYRGSVWRPFMKEGAQGAPRKGRK